MSTIIRNEKFFCTCCGGEFILNLPISLSEATKKMRAFADLHEDCKQTWVEPEVDRDKSIIEKAMWWLVNGETGNSSKTMWNCFMGHKDFPINHPYDPDDFKRCYKLLQAVPEWKTELQVLKPLSKQWSNLVDNWDKLTEMFGENERTNWEKCNEIGMYEFMQTLIKDA